MKGRWKVPEIKNKPGWQNKVEIEQKELDTVNPCPAEEANWSGSTLFAKAGYIRAQ